MNIEIQPSFAIDPLLSNQHTPVGVIARVAAQYHVSPTEILGRSRAQKIVTARQAAMRAVRETFHFSYPQIGALFNRDHTTVIWAMHRTEPRMRHWS